MVSENKGNPFVDLRSFLLISLAFENPLSITLFDGFNSGVYSLYPNGLAEWDTLKTVLRMATTGV